MAILICTDDTLVALSESKLQLEDAMAERFECRERKMTPTDLKGIDLSQEKNFVKISQHDYLTTKGTMSDDENPASLNKVELQRAMNDDELKLHCKNV